MFEEIKDVVCNANTFTNFLAKVFVDETFSRYLASLAFDGFSQFRLIELKTIVPLVLINEVIPAIHIIHMWCMPRIRTYPSLQSSVSIKFELHFVLLVNFNNGLSKSYPLPILPIACQNRKGIRDS